MKNVVAVIIILALGWYGYSQYQRRTHHFEVAESAAPLVNSPVVATPNAQYKCDGRIYCSQMTSCAEATYFLQNCPGTKMDGNNDGIPCERQWCK